MSNVFEKFTNQYSLSKTLRFELKPVGKDILKADCNDEDKKFFRENEEKLTSTLFNLRKNAKYDKNLQTFLKDQEIEDSYQILKPVFDKIHEEFITKSLESDEAKKIDFSEYYKLYKQQKEEKDKDEKKKLDKLIQDEEKKLREKFGEFYKIAGDEFKNNAGKDNKKKDILKEKSFNVLTEVGILIYLKNKLKDGQNYFDDLKLPEVKILVENNKTNKEKINKALEKINKFFTYFGGFNQNRENYYSIDEKTTAVASRVIDENLPKFFDNIIEFGKRKDEYLNVFQFLQKMEITLKDKNGNDLLSISEDIFEISYFSKCLSQKEIDEYNKKIGNANFVVNLYNQQKSTEQNFKKMQKFKILYKQIGCGEKKEFLKVIKDNNELNTALLKAKTFGERYFINDRGKDTVKTFIDYLLTLDNFENIYWSDKAINTISGKYFGNWSNLKEKMLKTKVFNKDKNTGEAKIPQAIQLSDLFEVLDEEKDWKEKGVLFRENFKENNEEKQKIIKNVVTPHEALLKMICEDIEVLVNNFVNGIDTIFKIEEKNYLKDENKEKIKAWLDNALFVNQILKYWKVKPRYSSFYDEQELTKISEIIEDYDIIRNYLTKKPQDDIRENRLKLNFENGSLLGGWSDGQEKVKSAVILQKEDKYYLGILKQRNIFDTSNKENNSIYQNTDNIFKRLFLKNLPYKTLAGRGFVSEFGKKYSDMAKENPQKAIESLKKIIANRYVVEYPLLQKILDKEYGNDKKIFDAETQEVLKDSYVCEFSPVNSKVVNENIDNGNMYLFEIKCNPNKIQWNYWKNILSKKSPHQLAGQGEIFYRPAGLENKIKKGYERKSWVIENKRYTEEKFLYHQATKRNYKFPSYSKITSLINENVIDNKNQLFLGIDRGEKHLAYYSLINLKGKILEQGSFNKIFNGNIEFDYADKLEKIAGERDEARKNWTTIGNIKDLKDGYISQVIRKIVDLVIYNEGDRKKGFREAPAFIVLEDLNIGFKRGRQKIEKQVYQKLELALAKKLNFLVDKHAKNNEIGSTENALQLTPLVRDFGDIKGKQFGLMLYTNPSFTSTTDPTTGWHKSISIKKGSEKYIKDQIMKFFDDFGFDGKDYYFKYRDVNTNKPWILYSGYNGNELDRFKDKFSEKEGQKHWNPEKIEIVKNLKNIFNDFDEKKSFKKQIEENKELNKIEKDRTAWESLRFIIEVIQQIRNTGTEEKDNDFILSPVRDEINFKHFDSRMIKENEKLPQNGDANGAYNIAKKGIIMFERIKEKPEKPNLFIKNQEWDKFTQK
ncbi:MAG: type V CRISPR-associated protein Cas12a/Cpf1 [Patescibacteria group bacterium]